MAVGKIPPESALAVEWDKADANAIKACFAGTANADQQVRAMNVIVLQFARVWDMPYRSDKNGGERDTAFACGRMYVGHQVLKMKNIDLSTIKEKPNG